MDQQSEEPTMNYNSDSWSSYVNKREEEKAQVKPDHVGTLSIYAGSHPKDPHDAETEELLSLADTGDFGALADRISEELKSFGATEKDLAMIQYFRDVAVPNNREWKKWARDMAIWVRSAVKKQKRK